MSRLTDEIRDQARADRAMEEAEGKSEAQARASLEKKGVDVDAAFAKLEAAIAATEPKAPPVRPRRSWAFPAVAFAGGVALLGGIEGLLVLGGSMSMHFGPSPTATLPTKAAASEAQALRDKAFRAYAEGRYAESLDDLDKAKALDAAGDADPTVVTFRRAAERALDH